MSSHLSDEQITEWIAGERSGEMERHVQECPTCAAELARLQSSMALFRTSGNQVAAYWEKQPAPRRSRRIGGWLVAGAAVAVAAILAVSLPHTSVTDTPPSQLKQQVFTRIPYVAPPAPYERTEVVHLDVPVAALIAAGLKMNAPAGDSVSADILIGQDGRPLAVSFPESNQ